MDEAMWDILTFGGPSLRWFARQPQGGITGGTVFSPKALSRVVSNLRSRWDLYFNVNYSPKRTGIRVSSEDITEWRTVLLDIDPTSPDADPYAAAALLVRRAAALLGPVPATVVDSGRGVQVHLHLTPLELTRAEDRLRVRHAVGAFLRSLVPSDAAPLFGCILDLSCSDLARVARMPNTINHKTGRMTQLISDSRQPSVPVAGHNRIGINPERILALAPVALHRVDKRPIEDGLRYQQVWSRLTAAAQKFLSEGSLEGSRHRSCVAAVKSLYENGVPAGETERVIRLASGRCTPPLGYSEALRIIGATYRA